MNWLRAELPGTRQRKKKAASAFMGRQPQRLQHDSDRWRQERPERLPTEREKLWCLLRGLCGPSVCLAHFMHFSLPFYALHKSLSRHS